MFNMIEFHYFTERATLWCIRASTQPYISSSCASSSSAASSSSTGLCCRPPSPLLPPSDSSSFAPSTAPPPLAPPTARRWSSRCPPTSSILDAAAIVGHGGGTPAAASRRPHKPRSATTSGRHCYSTLTPPLNPRWCRFLSPSSFTQWGCTSVTGGSVAFWLPKVIFSVRHI
jgi:hypothetical protein